MPPYRKTTAIAGQTLSLQRTDDSSRTLIDTASQIAYHSGSGAAAETRHVYLANGGVCARFASGDATSVLEIGLGTGMGLLLTIDEAVACDAKLEYHAVEFAWLEPEVLSLLRHGEILREPVLWNSYLNWRASLGSEPEQGTHRWQPAENVHVQVHHTDARDFGFDEIGMFDVIYFDPFDARENPDLWQPSFLERMNRVLKLHGRLVTYCVNRRVKEALREAGFEPRAVRGPKGGKRDVMIATQVGASAADDSLRV